jgi:hypothetical protein
VLSVQHLLAAWEWRLVGVVVFTGVEIASGAELAASVEKAATRPVQKATTDLVRAVTAPVEKAVHALEKTTTDGRCGGEMDEGRQSQ